MAKAREAGPRRATGGQWGLLVLLASGTACPGDDGADTRAGSTGDATASAEGTTRADEGSTGGGSTGGGSTGGGSTGEGSSGEDTTGAPVEEVLFPEVLAVIQAECFCHRSDTFTGQLDLRDEAAYASLVGVPAVQAPALDRVTPGATDESYLYLKLTGQQATVGGAGTRMPQGGVLTDDQILLVRNWILTGAQP